MTCIEDLHGLTLSAGSHKSWVDGVCLMEACSWMVGEPWSDHPTCVSPVLVAYGRALNDSLPHDLRQVLKWTIPQLLNTADDGLDEARGFLAVDWLIRVYTPEWLRLISGLVVDADRLASLPSLATAEGVSKITGCVSEAADHADAALAATLAVAGASGTYGQARVSTKATGWGTAASARDAATQALAVSGTARAVTEAAGAGAHTIASLAANKAAAGAARVAAVRATATVPDHTAARDAAVARLAPTVTWLHRASIDLFEQMIDPVGPAHAMISGVVSADSGL